MSQTSLATEATRTAAVQNTADYTASAAAHIAGDLGKHNQVAVYDQDFNTMSLASRATYGSHKVVDAECIRLLVTIGQTNYAVIIPGIPIGSWSGGGTDAGGAYAESPEFTVNPTGAELVAGTAVTLTVAVSGTGPIFLQWTKNGVSIPGATLTTYSISSFQTADAGNYVCIATNSVGQTLSTTATLAIRVTTTPSTATREGVSAGSSGGGGCFTGNTFITMADGRQQLISTLRKGDRVRSLNITGLNPGVEEAWRGYAEKNLQAVQSTSVIRAVMQANFTYHYVINGELEVTYEHPLLTKRGSMWRFMRAQDVKPGDYLFRGHPTVIKHIVRVDRNIQTWNLDVEPFDTYFANGYVAHNVYYK